mmetsp:Transcript_547/g.1668  ORF Transcript_547/g.1668 Transcript_547/m.1668 type:complete len:370 (-) Transcript_547:237-1346(-)
MEAAGGQLGFFCWLHDWGRATRELVRHIRQEGGAARVPGGGRGLRRAVRLGPLLLGLLPHPLYNGARRGGHGPCGLRPWLRIRRPLMAWLPGCLGAVLLRCRAGGHVAGGLRAAQLARALLHQRRGRYHLHTGAAHFAGEPALASHLGDEAGGHGHAHPDRLLQRHLHSKRLAARHGGGRPASGGAAGSLHASCAAVAAPCADVRLVCHQFDVLRDRPDVRRSAGERVREQHHPVPRGSGCLPGSLPALRPPRPPLDHCWLLPPWGLLLVAQRLLLRDGPPGPRVCCQAGGRRCLCFHLHLCSRALPHCDSELVHGGYVSGRPGGWHTHAGDHLGWPRAELPHARVPGAWHHECDSRAAAADSAGDPGH